MNLKQRTVVSLLSSAAALLLGDRLLEIGTRSPYQPPRDLVHGPLAEALNAVKHAGPLNAIGAILLVSAVAVAGFLVAWLATTPTNAEAHRREIGEAVLHDALRMADAKVKLEPNHALSFSARFLAKIKTLFQ
jgi:hypothetical protein